MIKKHGMTMVRRTTLMIGMGDGDTEGSCNGSSEDRGGMIAYVAPNKYCYLIRF